MLRHSTMLLKYVNGLVRAAPETGLAREREREIGHVVLLGRDDLHA